MIHVQHHIVKHCHSPFIMVSIRVLIDIEVISVLEYTCDIT